MELSALSLVVPMSVILMVIATKRVALSLFVGILVSAFLLHSFNVSGVIDYIYHRITSVFYTYESAFVINLSNLYVFGFLILLGILSQIIFKSGSVQNFVKKAKKYTKNAKTPEFIAFFVGIIIFVDDYFNALTVGQISKSLNDAHNSTRERLAYIIDSTSAPVCLLVPISSWGAYIMGIMNNDKSPLLEDSFSVLLSSLSSNYYAIFALIAVFLTIFWQINLPSMKKYQNVGVKDFYNENEQEESPSKLAPLSLLPISILILIVSISSLIFYTGYVLKNTDASLSLFYGGLFSLVITYFLAYRFLEKGSFFKIIFEGFKSMGSAILILTLAWAIGPVIRDDMQTGLYLAQISKEFLSSGGSVYMPLIFFLISGFIAFSTGTSWGAFAIMLPIGASMASESDIILIVSAILSGAVYGDHTSPISDTTILSATGAGCSVQSHFITQLPYATITMLCSMVSLMIASFTHSNTLALVVGLALLVGVFYVLKVVYRKKELVAQN
ncbi:Na+/H+ antiporter NhaC family protein [Helicobacter cetorum]|uniref:Integral membrane protein n=1 Tax=Helicobacter cetorum (strain ATCC BAA-540 / CCUG 52418 / MIT 99-5656) TaxID=1163745 RepID=I0ER49_HELCM|nr:Na+/H+ antiporter NhaC family protein [Helicobacter cetorum]AFI05418.1 integral membrane protein [Helicobacter cetorum MIT 99-5656]